MAKSPELLFQGPANVYFADFGATEPTTAAEALDAGWTDVGFTIGGTAFNVDREVARLTGDQILYSVATVPTSLRARVVTRLAQPTLELLSLALNTATLVTPGAGEETFEPDFLQPGEQETYRAILLRGAAPGTGRTRTAIFRRCQNIAAVELAGSKEDQSAIPVDWEAHYVSEAIKPYKFLDGPSA